MRGVKTFALKPGTERVRAAPDVVSRSAGVCTSMHAPSPLATAWLQSESDFYLAKRWCLNPFPTVAELAGRLRESLHLCRTGDEVWQDEEGVINAMLMSCAIADTIDDYLVGVRYDFAKALALVPTARPVVKAIDGLYRAMRRVRAWRLRDLARWRRNWSAAIEEFAAAALVSPRTRPDAIDRARDRLELLLARPFPDDLNAARPRIPGAFRRHDLTHHDVLAMARKFAVACPDRRRPLLVLGLRTAGSYFAPVIAACLRVDGYEDVDTITIRPKSGVETWEVAPIARCAKRGGLVTIVDEPLDTGATLACAIGALRDFGIDDASIVALLPVHPHRRDWSTEFARLAIGNVRVVRLEPEEWYKRQRLAPAAVEGPLRGYFRHRGYRDIAVIESEAAAAFDAELARAASPGFGTRLKRVYEVHLTTADGSREIRYVLAKSVGWGWFAYHAFIAAEALAPHLPPVLGLREGILYVEWLPQPRRDRAIPDREATVRTIASYVAARARRLQLAADPCPDLGRSRHHDGIEMLGGVLGGACASRAAAALRGPRIRHELARGSAAMATLIDGRMCRSEWIACGDTLRKTDFEHHGLGKSELNVTDPAYDLADAILGFGLSHDEEHALIARYAEESGDRRVRERLLLNKLWAGSAAMNAALACLANPRVAPRHDEANRRYLEAWHFLTAHAARHCGDRVAKPPRIRWSPPLMVLDLDGVVDTRRFGFPATTAAGIRALALLHAHGVTIALNTARPLGEVKTYCEAYGCAGAVAEYGSVVWDAVADRQRVLARPASLRQLERVRAALREMPDVYLDDTYRYSIRGYRFAAQAMVPLPAAIVANVMTRVAADELTVRQTTIDTAIHARDVDKGKGLRALLDDVGLSDLDTVAVGDADADLPMFRVARRSFAPASVLCRKAAAQMGCHIVGASYQRGLLEAARHVVHPDGKRCASCAAAARTWPRADDLFLQLLGFADQARASALLRALVDPMAIRAFVKSA
jgi:hydroxymethylpyrimidine pyrophosphatase-like HAD family hydrolase